MVQGTQSDIYLDVCVLGRPYDDQSFLGIQAETAAVTIITSHVRMGVYQLCYSPAHDSEVSRNTDETERSEILKFLSTYGYRVAVSNRGYAVLESRALSLEAKGIGLLDAFHIAYAERSGAAFITCDKRMLKKCARVEIEVWSGGPIDFCRKEGLL